MRKACRSLRFPRKRDWRSHFQRDRLGHFLKTSFINFHEPSNITDAVRGRSFAPGRECLAGSCDRQINVFRRACRDYGIRLLVSGINDLNGLGLYRSAPCAIDIEVCFLNEVFLKHRAVVRRA